MAPSVRKLWEGRVIRVPGSEFSTPDIFYAGLVTDVAARGGRDGTRFQLTFEDDGSHYWYKKSQCEKWWHEQGRKNFVEEGDDAKSCESESDRDEAAEEDSESGSQEEDDEEPDSPDGCNAKRVRTAGRGRGRGRPAAPAGPSRSNADDQESEAAWGTDDLEMPAEASVEKRDAASWQGRNRSFLWLFNMAVITAYKYQQHASDKDDAIHSQKEFRAALVRGMVKEANNKDRENKRPHSDTQRPRTGLHGGYFPEAAMHSPGKASFKSTCAACKERTIISYWCVQCMVHLHIEEGCWQHWHNAEDGKFARTLGD
eukprot:jgi/Mesvir1/19137/Mv11903-RA.1